MKNKAIVVAKQEYADAEKGMNNANVDDGINLDFIEITPGLRKLSESKFATLTNSINL